MGEGETPNRREQGWRFEPEQAALLGFTHNEFMHNVSSG